MAESIDQLRNQVANESEKIRVLIEDLQTRFEEEAKALESSLLLASIENVSRRLSGIESRLGLIEGKMEPDE